METIIFNPLENPATVPVAVTLTILFGVGGLALMVAGLVKKQSLVLSNGEIVSQHGTPMRVLWQRYGTWVAIAFLYGGACLFGPLFMALLAGFMCWQGLREYAGLALLPGNHRRLAVGAGWLTIGLTLWFDGSILQYALPVSFFGFALVALAPVADEKNVEKRFGLALQTYWSYLYLGWLPAHLVAIGKSDWSGLLLALGLAVATSDVGAFCAGKLIGGPKLAPRISPNKTVGGLAGNLAGALLGVLLFAFVLPGWQWWQLLLAAAIIMAGSVWGDLLESLLKRQAGVKDAGNLLPGFGGLLDRIDSLLVAAPLVYYFALIFIR